MPKLSKKSHQRYSHNFLDREAREVGLQNDLARYGDLLPYVRFLRQQGWVIFQEGLNYRVGTKLRDAWQLVEIYQRVKERHDREVARAGQEMGADATRGGKGKAKGRGGARHVPKGRGGKRVSRKGAGKKAARGGNSQPHGVAKTKR